MWRQRFRPHPPSTLRFYAPFDQVEAVNRAGEHVAQEAERAYWAEFVESWQASIHTDLYVLCTLQAATAPGGWSTEPHRLTSVFCIGIWHLYSTEIFVSLRHLAGRKAESVTAALAWSRLVLSSPCICIAYPPPPCLESMFCFCSLQAAKPNLLQKL